MMKKTFLIPLLSITIFFTMGSVLVLAQGGGRSGETGGGNPVQSFELNNPFGVNTDSLFGLLQKVINDILLPIGGILCVIAFIVSGFMYVLARGDPGKIKTAHNALLAAAIGTALVLGAWVFANAICGTIELISENPNICPTN